MKTVGKQSLINYLEFNGMEIGEAEKAVTLLLTGIRENLMQGNKVTLTKIGTLNSKLLGEETKKQFGKSVDLPKRVKVKFVQSKTLQEDYAKVNEATKEKTLRSLFS